jgi:hypothetical protein
MRLDSLLSNKLVKPVRVEALQDVLSQVASVQPNNP